MHTSDIAGAAWRRTHSSSIDADRPTRSDQRRTGASRGPNQTRAWVMTSTRGPSSVVAGAVDVVPDRHDRHEAGTTMPSREPVRELPVLRLLHARRLEREAPQRAEPSASRSPHHEAAG